MLDLQRMLDKCVRDQWSIEQLDWSSTPRSMSREDEEAIVQYFTDMVEIERLAKALFEEQRRRADDPVLKKIFATFVVDEERHAQVAERLAAHYDVHRLREYHPNPALEKFKPAFLRAIREFSAEVANVYITTGELLLDVALLRSIDDYVDDDMSRQAMKLINRDESRHIAIDYHMVEYYSSPSYRRWLREQPRRPLRQHASAWVAFGKMIAYGTPFIRGVFLEPLARVDPSGRRVREAFKRMQLLGHKPEVARRPFPWFVNTLRSLYQQPVVSIVVGPVITRIAGIPGDYLRDLHTADEARRAARMSYEDLAEEALAAKYAN